MYLLKQLRLNRKEKFLVLNMTILCLTVSVIGYILIGEIIIYFLMIFLIIVILSLLIVFYLRIFNEHKARRIDYNQIEALFSIYTELDLKAPLPQTRNMAASPDLLKLIIMTIKKYRPKTVLELGSGISTIVCAYSLEKIDKYKLVSVDHEEEYASFTKDNLKNHNFSNHIDVIHAPLKEINIDGQTKLWYDLDKLKDIRNIDLLIVDGPPRNIQRLSRYPALPLLFKQLSKNAVIIVDDCYKNDEKLMLNLWKQKYPTIIIEKAETEKEAHLVKKVGD